MERNSCKFYFRFVCIIVVIFMIGYWLYKYEVEDRDIGVVDYISLVDAKDIDFPRLTLCIKTPFVAKKLSETIHGLTSKLYLKYLTGEYSNDSLNAISYENITVDLNNYFMYAQEKMKNDSLWRNSSLSFFHKEIFNGFYLSYLLKCYSVENNIEEHRNLNKIRMYYKGEELIDDIVGSKVSMYYKINYPGQFLIGENPHYFSMKAGHSRFVRIKKIEFLRRRDTRKKKCSKGNISYDQMIMKKHATTSGCRPPYLNVDTAAPDCTTSSQLKSSRFEYEMTSIIDYPKDCKRMSEIQVIAKKETNPLKTKWRFGMSYPEEVKIITQAKEIDIHSLLGNIGGYFGLFLGKI